MNNHIRPILEAALLAPSGGNFQPWRFVVNGNQIMQFNIPEKTANVYRLRGHDPVSHGIMIETIRIAASKYGYTTAIKLFPDKSDGQCIALIELNQTGEPPSPLSEFISIRVCNRKPYHVIPLKPEHREALLAAPKELTSGRLLIVEDPRKIVAIAQAASVNEQLGLQNSAAHATLFGHLRFTQAEHERLRDGLYVKTLEMPPPAEFAFRHLFRHWPVARALRRLGVPKKVGQQVAAVCSASPAYGAIVMKESRDEDLITAGQLMQRVWLTASQLGASLQPTTGLVHFMQRLLDGEKTEFSEKQQGLIRESHAQMKEALGMTNETLAMVFRLGYSDSPSAVSLRYRFEQVVDMRAEPDRK